MKTMADGIAVGLPGRRSPSPRSATTSTRSCTVSEESLSRALLALVERAKMVVEPAGAAAVAALLDDPTAFGTPAVAVLSGGNIDPLLLGKVIRHGMAAAGRYLNLRVCIPDTPGGLARLLSEVAASGANVLEVVHERISPPLHLDEVEVQLQLETRGTAARRAGARPGSASAATASSSESRIPPSRRGRKPAHDRRGHLRRLGGFRGQLRRLAGLGQPV